MDDVIRILRYLKETIGRGIMFEKIGQLALFAYTYIDWVGDQDGRKSTSGYLTLVEENLIS